MPSSRYTYRRLQRNRLRMYREQIKPRSANVIEHYDTPNMTYPDSSQMKRITAIKHVWGLGDRYYKLAHKHYGQTKLWWLIAWFNKAPTESHLSTGQVIMIPTPLEAALSYMRNAK